MLVELRLLNDIEITKYKYVFFLFLYSICMHIKSVYVCGGMQIISL